MSKSVVIATPTGGKTNVAAISAARPLQSDSLAVAVLPTGTAAGAAEAAHLHAGQVSNTSSPEFCEAIGLSGTIQQRAGTGDACTIAAINRDDRESFAGIAHAGLIGDLR